MTPRPEIFAVPGTLSLKAFTAQINKHVFSRVPVYSTSLDNVTGIAFAHDLLQVLDTIEDLLEAIGGSIADEHEEAEADDAPVREPNGAYVVSGSFEISRLRDLFADQFDSATRRHAE